MCQYRTLFHEVNTGYVIHCTDCGRFQIAFSNLIITFTLVELSRFRKSVEKMKNDQMEVINPHLRCIMLPTSAVGVQLLLSAVELTDLFLMLEEADTELQSLELLNMFKQ